MSALTETTSSPTLVGFPSHLTPSATFRPSQCNLNQKKGAASEEVWIEPVEMDLADDA